MNDGHGEVVDELVRREGHQQLRNEIEQLPDSLRHIFVVVVLDGYTYRQAAELLSIPVGTVAARLIDARGRLRRSMGRLFSEEVK